MSSSSDGQQRPSGEEVPGAEGGLASDPSARRDDDDDEPAPPDGAAMLGAASLAASPPSSSTTAAGAATPGPGPSSLAPPAAPVAVSNASAATASTTTTAPATTSTKALTPRLGSTSRKSYSSSLRSPVLTSSSSSSNLLKLDSPRVSSSSLSLSMSLSRQPSPSSSSVAPSPSTSVNAGIAGAGAADDVLAPLLTSNSSSLSLSQPQQALSQPHSHRTRPSQPSKDPPLAGSTPQLLLLPTHRRTPRSARHRPRPAHKCPVLGCYYAEFDNQAGPKVCYQTPPGFMERYPMDASVSEMEAILDATLTALLQREGGEPGDESVEGGAHDNRREEIGVDPSRRDEGAGTGGTSHRVGENENSRGAPATAPAPPPPPPPPPPSAPMPPASTADDASIFASCSDFIITGSELTGSILNLSTHQIHVLSRPTLLSHERYERNALLFSAGFVLRRTEDPRPFRAVLNQLSSALADAEHETQLLSRPSTRPRILQILEQLLLDLNSPSGECHLHLDAANGVDLKLFHPPKPPAKPVPEYAVPIVLRRDRHVQLYDWDLAINWVSLHVDGILNSRQIARGAEVDLDMVLQCLRVLRHHSVIALVDMFFFTNRYQGTDRAAEMLAGRHPDLLLAAAHFCARGGGGNSREAGRGVGVGHGTAGRRISHSGGTDWSPSLLSNNSDPHFPPPRGGTGGLGGGNHVAPDMASSPGGGGRSASYDDRHPGGSYFHVSPRYHRSSLDSNAAIAGLSSSPGTAGPPLLRPEEEAELKAALAELYCACHAGVSIGDLWVELLSSSRGAGSGASKRWRRAFQKIDHRRFTSFGLVHGLLRRMHCYPMVLHSTLDDEERELLSAPATEPEPSAATFDVPSLTRERSARSTSAGSQSRPPSSTQSVRLPSGNPQTDRRTILRVAHLMDGTRCDDEIVSLIGQPLEKLLEMVADRSVTCTYAPASHY